MCTERVSGQRMHECMWVPQHSGSEKEAKHTPERPTGKQTGQHCADSPPTRAGHQGAGLGGAALSGRLPEEVHGVARARDELGEKQMKAGDGIAQVGSRVSKQPPGQHRVMKRRRGVAWKS